MGPNFFDITYFQEVAKCRNISRAAEKLGITQPSLSASMKRLETAVGAELLIRGKTGIQLTQSGEEMLLQSRAFLSNWQDLRQQVLKRKNEVSGRYVLGCHASVALYTLAKFLPQLLERYPDLEINLEHDLSRLITERVISSAIDFGLVINPVKHPDLVIRELLTDEVTFWVRAGRAGSRSMAGQTLICDMNLLQTQNLLNTLARQRVAHGAVLHSASLEVVGELTAQGMGVGVLPGRVASRQQPGLRRLDPSLPKFQDRLCLIYRADAQKTKAGEAIIEAIKTGLQTK